MAMIVVSNGLQTKQEYFLSGSGNRKITCVRQKFSGRNQQKRIGVGPFERNRNKLLPEG